MSTNQGPHGRLPRSVYIKRRLWVLAALIAVIAIIVLLIWRPGSSAGKEDHEKNAAAVETSTPQAQSSDSSKKKEGDSESTGECTEDQVTVKAATDKKTYASGEKPKLTLSITNTGDDPCTMDVGTSQQVFTITSGKDTYWTSTDCQSKPTNSEMTLKPGKEVTTDPAIEWDRTRSNPDTCDSDEREKVPADGASYHLSTSVNGIESEKTAQFSLY